MEKKRLLSSMAIVGYGLVGIFVVLAIAIAIMIGINGFGRLEKKVNNILFSMPDNISGVTTSNNVTNISTEELHTAIDFKIAGIASADTVDYSTRTITVVINNSSTSFAPANKDETSVWFAQTNENGEPLVDEAGNYIPVDSNRINVKVNDTITLILATTQYPDDELNPNKDAFYLKGGISHLHARSGDALLQAQELKVEVDVPVVNFEITVKGYDYNDESGQKVDLTESVKKTEKISYKDIKKVVSESDEFLNLSDTTKDYLGRTMFFAGESTSRYTYGKYYTVVTKANNTIGWEENNSLRYFIKGTELELGVRAFPYNATSAVLGSFKKAVFTINGSSTDSAVIPEGSNVFTVVGFDDTTTGSITVTATVPKLLSSYNRVEREIIIETARYEIEKIEITNEDYKDGVIECLLNEPVLVSFNQNATDFNIGLGVKVIPKFYNGHNNPYAGDFTSIHSEIQTNQSDFGIGVENPINAVAQGMISPISVLSSNEQKQGGLVANKVSTIVANRLLYQGEEVYLFISGQRPFTDLSQPYKVFLIKPVINKPETNHQNEELNELVYNDELSVYVAKQDNRYREKTGSTETGVEIDDDVIVGPGILSIEKDSELKITYTKEEEKPIIYRSTNPTLTYKWVYFAVKEASASGVDEGEDKSNVILLSKTGQVKTATTFGTQVYAVSDGIIAITPKLILCDANGNPLNCFYKTFEVDDDTGYLISDYIKPTDLKEENEKNYVVIYDPEISINIEVIESLTSLAFFYDSELSDIVNQYIEVASSSFGSNKSLYMIGNSTKALQNVQLQATLRRSDQTSATCTVVSGADWSKITISETRADDGCYIEFTVPDRESPIAVLNAKIKAVDIQSIDALFDVVDELKQKPLISDVGRRVYYNGPNTTIISNSVELNVQKGQFYVVKQTESESPIYYWDNAEAQGLTYDSGMKNITLIEGVESSGEIWFKIGSGSVDFPNSVYYNLTVKREHGYESLDVSGTKTVGYSIFVMPNTSTNITVANFERLKQEYLSKKITIKEDAGALKLMLFDGWKNEIQDKYLYIVYTMHISQTLKAVDSYRINVDSIQSDLSLSRKTTKTVESTNYNIVALYANILSDNIESTDNIEIELQNTDTKVELNDVRDLLYITNNKTSTEYGFKAYADAPEYMSGSVLKATLMRVTDSGDVDCSNFVLIDIANNGSITMRVAEIDDPDQRLVFTKGNQENPLTRNYSYKLVIYAFDNVEGSDSCSAVEIPIKLGFNVGYTAR